MVILEHEGRKCDERCYDAHRLGCHCVCGGRNHGLGLQHALDNDIALDDEGNVIEVTDDDLAANEEDDDDVEE